MLPAEATDHPWLYRVGAIAALLNVAIIPAQIIVFMISPPPGAIADWYQLLAENPIIGLFNLDLFYLLNNILLIPIYYALFRILRRQSPVFVGLALATGLVGVAAYMPTNTAFEMLALSQHYAAANETQQAVLLAAGEALIVKYEGTAFLVYYLLNAAALLMFAAAMLPESAFSRATAYAGLLAGVLMLVPSTFGVVGLLFAFASLLPWAVFSLLLARALLRLSAEDVTAVTPTSAAVH
jgi:hypothetical protein